MNRLPDYPTLGQVGDAEVTYGARLEIGIFGESSVKQAYDSVPNTLLKGVSEHGY